MSTTLGNSFAYNIGRKTGSINDSQISELITDEGLLDDRDQGSPPSEIKLRKEEVAEESLNIHDRASTLPPTALFLREVGSQSLSSDIKYEIESHGVRRHKVKPKEYRRQHRKTKSSPNAAAFFSPFVPQSVEGSASITEVNDVNDAPIKKSTRRIRAISYSQSSRRRYGALEDIAEEDVLDITSGKNSPMTHHLNRDLNCYKHYTQPWFPPVPQSELKESVHDYLSHSQGCDNSNGAFIQSHLSSKHRNEDEKLKCHRRQRSVEHFMEEVKGTDQSLKCRDSTIAILFIIHVTLVIWIGIKYGSDALLIEKNTPSGSSKSNGVISHAEDISIIEGMKMSFAYKKIIALACICGISSMGLSILAFFVMTIFSTCLIQVALCLAIGLGFLWGTVGIILAPKNFVPLLGIFALGITIAYTFVVWDRIPLASVKLKVGLATLQGRKGIILFTFIIQTMFLFWTIFLTYATIGVYDAFKSLLIPSTKASRSCSYVCLMLSFIWTFQVSMHIVQVGVAGVVKEWWFESDDSPSSSSMWSKPSIRSLLRGCFFSFGSVCLGSLLVGFMNILRQMAECFVPKQEILPSCGHYYLVACQDFVISSIRSVGTFFNHWAFVYVGLYGYSFLVASQKATKLFKKRGWENIVNDDLISNILFMVSLLIGGTVGCFAVLIENTEGSNLTSMTNPSLIAFVIGFFIGTMLSCILFSIIKSCVDSVIVCFAGSPVELENNHKALSHELRLAWKNAWPGSVDYIYDPNFNILRRLEIQDGDNDAAFVAL